MDMGNIKNEVQEIITAVLKTFTTEYVKAYALELVDKAIEESMEEKEKKWKLKVREPCEDDIKSGYLTKEGAVRKSWKKRWFVVRWNYRVEYFENEAAFNKDAKPKGTMGLQGYKVFSDPWESLLGRAEKLAEMMGLEEEKRKEIKDKIKKYPDYTFEVFHPRRRSYYIHAENEEDKKEWVEMFETCCRNAPGFENEDEVHRAAFRVAVRETRWDLGRWGWWYYGGNEQQILSDLISEEIEYNTSGKILSKLPGSTWVLKNAARNKMQKMIDGMVSAAVTPAWKTMDESVNKTRPTLEGTIKENIEPVGKAKNDIRNKLKDAVMATITPAIEEHVAPHLAKIFGILGKPVNSAHSEVLKLYDKHTTEWIQKHGSNPKANLKELESVGTSWWSTVSARNHIYELYEPLDTLRIVFHSLSSSSIVWNGYDKINSLFDNAMYTFERKVKKMAEKGQTSPEDLEAARKKVREKLVTDATRQQTEFNVDTVKGIVFIPLNKTVVPLVEKLLEPIDSAIPDPLKQLINIKKEFNAFLDGVMSDAVEAALPEESKTLADN